jgi:ABC-type transport system involved in cytochrome bd biosynthesis fused ATPase/permease subunit
MQQLMRGRTTFIIAHRLSTVRMADLIVVLDEGAIVECGRPEQLLAIDSAYRRLLQNQWGSGVLPDLEMDERDDPAARLGEDERNLSRV